MSRRALLAIAVTGGLVLCTGTYVHRPLIAEALGGGRAHWQVPTAADGDTPDPVIEQNVGQFDDPVDFAIRGSEATVYLADGAMTYDARDGDRGQAVRMSVAGGDASVVPVASGLVDGPTSYFLGSDPSTWLTDVPAASTVVYPDVLEGVDLRYLSNDAGLQYDVVLDPGVEPSIVELRFDGADGLRIDDAGRLIVDVGVGDDLLFSAPVTYQPTSAGNVTIESSYRLTDDGGVGFDIGDHDPAAPLVIDPTLQIATLIGGSSGDYADSVGTTSNGDIIVVGRSDSTNFPTTVGAYDTTDQTGTEIVVARVAAAGSSLVWSTYVGGTGNDAPNSVEVNPSDQVVVTGYTTSTNFPVTVGAYDTTSNGSEDAVAFTLAAAGNSLVGSTYLGGLGSDYGFDLGLDAAGDVVVAGNTASSGFPTTLGAYDRTQNGSTDVFVSKFNAAFTSLTWSTFVGGFGADGAVDVDVDSAGGVHVVGDASSGYPTTVGAYDTSHNGGTDAFYSALSSTGATLSYSTFLGGLSNDIARAVEAYTTTSIFITGNTASSGFPTTAGAFDTSHNGGDDAFVARLDRSQSGSAVLAWSTFFGGAGTDWAADIAVDTYGRPVIGVTVAANGLATTAAPDTTLGGTSDAMAAMFTANGTARVFASYLGGSGDETVYGLVLDGSSRIVLAGETSSTTDFPVTAGAYDTSHNGGTYDTYVARYSAVPAPSVVQVNSTADGSDASAGNGVCETTTAGQCTLRAAIDEANASATVDTIDFAIPTSDGGYSAARGVFTLTPATGYPTITAGVTINGATQATNIGNTNAGTLGVTQSVGTGADGVVGTGDELSIDGVPRPEVEIDFPAAHGFHVTANNVTISGLAVFGGSSDVAIQSGTGIVVEDMVIGTRADSLSDPGAAARSDGGGGVYIVGGTNVTVRNNVIGYQNRRGIDILGNVTNVVVSGNEIRANGRNSTTEGGGIELIPYWGGGVLAGVTVSGNLIADHVNDFGIELAMTGAESGLLFENNTFTGNSIAAFNAYGTANSAGGTVRRNVVVTNLGHGIAVSDVHNWSILQNSVRDNPWEGIYLGTGANDSLAAPTPTTAVARSGTLTVGYSVTAPAGTYRVEFFDNTAADPIGNGEGETYRAAATISHPGGTVAYSASVPGTSGDIVSTTLTEDLGGGSYGSTSKFSATVTASLDPVIVVNSSGDAADATPGDELCRTGANNSAGVPACTLRAAIQEVNAHAGITTIQFAMPTTEAGYASGVWSISPTSLLPALSTTLTLDATTQTGWTSTPVVELRGTSMGGSPGLSVTGNDVTVRGLAVRDVGGTGVSVSGARVTLERNHIGTNAAGTTAAANSFFGVGLSGSDAVIQWNLVSGNGDDGIMLSPGAHRARIVDNRIGTTVTGNAALPNGQEGVELMDADDVVIGQPGHGNVISGNRYAGINAWTTASTGVKVQGNLIGVGADGVTALGNAAWVTEGGITFRGTSSGWLIGGSGAGEGNVIAYNTGDGVQLWNSQGIANDIAVIGNSIHDNTGLGIDLGDDGVTANDAGDSDAGANDRLNAPVISSVTVAAGVATAAYSLDVPAGSYRIEFFSNAAADPSGYGEGGTVRHAATVAHAGGSASYTASFALDGGEIVSATTTEVAGATFGATSEFSAVVTSVAPTSVVNSTGDAADASPGNGRCDTGATIAGGARECTLRAAITEANAHAQVNAITFSIPTTAAGYASGLWTIAPTSALPTLTTPMTIDATTQTGWTANTAAVGDNATIAVAIDGVSSGTTSGLVVTGGATTVRGLAIGRFTGSGIDLISNGNTVAGTRIGISAGGTVARANSVNGIFVNGTGNTIGGAALADRNVVSGNAATGIYVYVGGTNTVVGNVVGTNAAANAAVPNGHGVRLHGSPGNVVGGAGLLGNLISGNTGNGIWLRSAAATGNVITGNDIGPSATPGTYLANGIGILVDDATSGNVIGGATRAEGNVVGGNTGGGVVLHGSAGVPPQTTAILGNSVHGNGGLGIDLDNDGVTVNDAGDADAGSNDRLNAPVPIAATAVRGGVVVDLDLDVPAGSYRVEVFANPAGVDPSGRGEGESFVGAATVTHPGGGARRFSIVVDAEAGAALSTTVTAGLGGSYGATSEFSTVITATATAGTVLDRGTRRSDLDAVGGAVITPVAGAAGTAIDLAGGTARLAGPPTHVTSGALSLSGWVHLDALGTAPRLVSTSTGAGDAVSELLVDGTTGEALARVVIGATTIEVRGGAISTGAWHQLAATWDGATVRLFVDGAQVDAEVAAGVLVTDLDASVVVGNTGNGLRGLDGRVDQVRIGHAARSASDVATEYANVTQPAAFVTLGARQTSAPAAWSAGSAVHRTGTHALAAPQSTPGSSAWATATGLDEPGLAFESWWYLTAPTSGLVAAGTNTGTAATDQRETGLGAGGVDLATSSGGSRTVDASVAGSIAAGTWTRVEIRTDELGRSSVWIGGVQIITPTAHSGGASGGSAGLRADTLVGEQWYVDDVLLRRYVSDEPTSTVGPITRN